MIAKRSHDMELKNSTSFIELRKEKSVDKKRLLIASKFAVYNLLKIILF